MLSIYCVVIFQEIAKYDESHCVFLLLKYESLLIDIIVATIISFPFNGVVIKCIILFGLYIKVSGRTTQLFNISIITTKDLSIWISDS